MLLTQFTPSYSPISGLGVVRYVVRSSLEVTMGKQKQKNPDGHYHFLDMDVTLFFLFLLCFFFSYEFVHNCMVFLL